MFLREFTPIFSKDHSRARDFSVSPELPPREPDGASSLSLHPATASTEIDPSQIVFEPYVSSSSEGSDNDNLYEEIVPVHYFGESLT